MQQRHVQKQTFEEEGKQMDGNHCSAVYAITGTNNYGITL